MKQLLAVMWMVFLLSSGTFAADQTILTHVLSKTDVSWDGVLLPAYHSGTPEVTILRIEIPAGAMLPLHKHSVINAGVLIAGELTVATEGGKRLRLKTGESIVEVVDTWHYGMNEGDEKAEIIVFYAGVVDLPVTIRQETLHYDRQ